MINKEEVFTYLDDLRESGIVNMFHAANIVEARFDASRKEASQLLLEWMETFDQRYPRSE